MHLERIFDGLVLISVYPLPRDDRDGDAWKPFLEAPRPKPAWRRQGG